MHRENTTEIYPFRKDKTECVKIKKKMRKMHWEYNKNWKSYLLILILYFLVFSV